MKIALLIIDMQRCFVEEYPDRTSADGAVQVINYVAGMLRGAGHSVIHVQDIEDADEFSEEELAFIPEIDVAEGDLIIKKEYSNAFWKTSLEETLREREVDLLVLAGQAAEHCVVFTYNGAIERGFSAVVLQGGTASAKLGRVAALNEDRGVISWGAIQAIVNS